MKFGGSIPIFHGSINNFKLLYIFKLARNSWIFNGAYDIIAF
jgi:hypothetical protein